MHKQTVSRETFERLQQGIEILRARVLAHSGQGLTNREMRSALLDPFVSLLGWPSSDLQRVRADWSVSDHHAPIDLVWSIDSRPAVFVSTVALDQVVPNGPGQAIRAHAVEAEVRWVLLTNGHRWALHHISPDHETTEPCVSFSSFDHDAVELLLWLQPESLADEALDRIWCSLTAAARLRDAASRVFSSWDHELLHALGRWARMGGGDVLGGMEFLDARFSAPEVRPALTRCWRIQDDTPEDEPYGAPALQERSATVEHSAKWPF